MAKRSTSSKDARTAAPSKSSEGNWRDKITKAFERLSASNRKVASFLLEQPTEAAFMTGSQLATHLDLDPATIVRFAQMLGYDGYPALCDEIQTSVRAVFAAEHEIKEQTSGTPAANWQNSLLRSAGAIHSVASAASWKDARKVLGQLQAAQQVLVVSEGTDRLLGEWLAQSLRQSGLRALTLDADVRASRDILGSARNTDVVVGLGITADGKRVAEGMRLASAKGAKTVAMAVSASASVALAGEGLLACPANEGAATVSFAAVVESLQQALSAQS